MSCSDPVCFACVGTSVLFFLPTEYPVTADSMNWLVVVVGAVLAMGTLNWQYNSRHHFKGPPRHDEAVQYQENPFDMHKH
jgi:hypothetical protein